MFNICGSFCRLVDLVGLGDFARGGASSKAEKHSAQAGATIQRHFKLLSSKDNELRELKAQAQVESSLYMIKFEEIFKLAEQKLKDKYLAVENNLIQHENKLQNIEARLVTHKGVTQGSSRTVTDNLHKCRE